MRIVAEVNLEALHRGVDLLVIRDIGAQAHGSVALLLNFQLAQVDFRLATRQHSYPRASRRKAYREPLANPATSSRNKYGHPLECCHVSTRTEMLSLSEVFGLSLGRMVKYAVGIALSVGIGAACRWFDLPVPAPPTIYGALLILAITLGYMAVDTWFK